MKAVLIVIIVVAVAALIVVGLLARQRRQREGMRERFGTEYDRTVEQAGDRRAAERDLKDRTQRHESLQIKPLEPGAREQYAQQWRQAQEQFVDEPQVAVKQADDLVARALRERGYPVGDFEQQVRDVSVEHSTAVGEYRAAHQISTLNDQGGASTEQLREAMVHYRALFAELLEGGADERETTNP
jgi:FtsZ-interacting cell division protein ZipA